MPKSRLSVALPGLDVAQQPPPRLGREIVATASVIGDDAVKLGADEVAHAPVDE